ncbi:MAG: hypothetical protein GY791_03930 [Alphaproteobacteria bacterium]|nr:hypothetical protein [Alphaproteobacteria bacterium]
MRRRKYLFCGVLPAVSFGLFAALAPISEASADSSFFGSQELFVPGFHRHTKWASALRRFASATHRGTPCATGEQVNCADDAWSVFVASLRDLDRKAQLGVVNSYFNRARYVSDANNYGRSDYWASPRQLLARGGDCEDYAIAKYLTLRAAGVATRDLRILVVNDLETHRQHAILVVFDGTRVWALDNQIARVTDTRRIHSYRPIYAINETGWWVYSYPRSPKKEPKTVRVAASAGFKFSGSTVARTQ